MAHRNSSVDLCMVEKVINVRPVLMAAEQLTRGHQRIYKVAATQSAEDNYISDDCTQVIALARRMTGPVPS